MTAIERRCPRASPDPLRSSGMCDDRPKSGLRPQGATGFVGPVCPHLYAAGSGESDGLAKRFVIIVLGGKFRLMPLGGIGLWNHLA